MVRANLINNWSFEHQPPNNAHNKGHGAITNMFLAVYKSISTPPLTPIYLLFLYRCKKSPGKLFNYREN